MTMRMIVRTIISSMRVMPRERSRRTGGLPVCIFGSIESRVGALAIYVENILAAPALGGGVVLHGAHAPFRSAGHGVLRDAAQKADLLVDRACHLDAVHHGLEVRRIPLGLELGRRQLSLVGGVFVLVDCLADLAQGIV